MKKICRELNIVALGTSYQMTFDDRITTSSYEHDGRKVWKVYVDFFEDKKIIKTAFHDRFRSEAEALRWATGAIKKYNERQKI